MREHADWLVYNELEKARKTCDKAGLLHTANDIKACMKRVHHEMEKEKAVPMLFGCPIKIDNNILPEGEWYLVNEKYMKNESRLAPKEEKPVPEDYCSCEMKEWKYTTPWDGSCSKCRKPIKMKPNEVIFIKGDPREFIRPTPKVPEKLEPIRHIITLNRAYDKINQIITYLEEIK